MRLGLAPCEAEAPAGLPPEGWRERPGAVRWHGDRSPPDLCGGCRRVPRGSAPGRWVAGGRGLLRVPGRCRRAGRREPDLVARSSRVGGAVGIVLRLPGRHPVAHLLACVTGGHRTVAQRGLGRLGRRCGWSCRHGPGAGVRRGRALCHVGLWIVRLRARHLGSAPRGGLGDLRSGASHPRHPVDEIAAADGFGRLRSRLGGGLACRRSLWRGQDPAPSGRGWPTAARPAPPPPRPRCDARRHPRCAGRWSCRRDRRTRRCSRARP